MTNYSANEKATGLDVLTTLANDDVVVVGDTSDSGKAKVITKENLKVQMESGLVNATATDTIASFLDDKIEITSDDNSVIVTKAITNAGVNEKIVYNLRTNSSSSDFGGTKIGIDSTQEVVLGSANTDVYTIPIPGGSLGTNNGIGFRAKLSLVDLDGTADFTITYGGETIGTISTSGSGDTVGIIEGTIVADGATDAQKAEMEIRMQSNSVIKMTGNYTMTVDSDGDEDIVFNVQTDSGAKATFEHVMVWGIVGSTTPTTTSPSVASYSFAQETGSATELVILKPSGLAVNDLMFVHIQNYATTPSLTLPAGWTQIDTATNGQALTITAYKIADAGDTSATDFTFTGAGGIFMGAITRFIGQSTTVPIGDSSISTGSATTATATTITPTFADSLILLGVATCSGGYDVASWITPGIATDDITWIEVYNRRFNNGSIVGTLALFSGARVQTTATGNGTLTAQFPTNTPPYSAILESINPL